MKHQNLFFAAAGMAAVLALGITGRAETYTTPDSVLCLELPGEEWKQEEEESVWVKLSNGEDEILLEHLSNGETLPELAAAGSGCEAVCQLVLSTENEVFILTGKAAKREELEEMREILQSAKILEYDTKTAVRAEESPKQEENPETEKRQEPEAEAKTEAVVETASFSVWVTSKSLNIRSSFSTDAPILGSAFYADALKVTGIVRENGQETGWYQVETAGGEGYVSAQYVSQTPPTAERSGITLTEETIPLYESGGEGAAYVSKATDGGWYDGSGRSFADNGDGTWTCLDSGRIWTEEPPSPPVSTAGQSVAVMDEEGLNSQTLYYDEAAGIWANTAGGVYTQVTSQIWQGPDGGSWFLVN